MEYEHTIERPVETAGVGLHTGVSCSLKLLPAPSGTGIVFRRVDLDGFEVEALARNIARVSYATSLMKKGVLISTTEHLLAALYACGIDNVYVELDNLELPILDGSARPFVAPLAPGGRRRPPPAARPSACPPTPTASPACPAAPAPFASTTSLSSCGRWASSAAARSTA